MKPPSDSLPFTLELPQLTKVKGTHLRTKKKGVSFASDFGGENDYAPLAPTSTTPKSNPAISSFLSQAEELVSQAESALERAESIDRDIGVQRERPASRVDKDYLEYSTFAGPHKISAGMNHISQF